MNALDLGIILWWRRQIFMTNNSTFDALETLCHHGWHGFPIFQWHLERWKNSESELAIPIDAPRFQSIFIVIEETRLFSSMIPIPKTSSHLNRLSKLISPYGKQCSCRRMLRRILCSFYLLQRRLLDHKFKTCRCTCIKGRRRRHQNR